MPESNEPLNPDWQPTPDARERLLAAATEIFADKGYAQASTREICRLAGVNVASIHYYFGNKAALYREVFRMPERILHRPPELSDPAAPLRLAVRAWYRHLLSFLHAPAEANRIRLLVLREQMQPSGLVDGSRSDVLKPYHEHLTSFLCVRLGVTEPDMALHQLACSLAGMAVILLVERAAIQRLVPGMLDTPEDIDATVDRLTDTACILIEHEHTRRARPGPTTGPAVVVASVGDHIGEQVS